MKTEGTKMAKLERITDDQLEALPTYDQAMLLWFLRGYLEDSEEFQAALARGYQSHVDAVARAAALAAQDGQK